MNKALMSIFTSLWLFSTSDFAQVRELPALAGRGSGQPNQAVAPDGRVYLSWIERLGEGGFSLRFALKEGDGLSFAKTRPICIFNSLACHSSNRYPSSEGKMSLLIQ